MATLETSSETSSIISEKEEQEATETVSRRDGTIVEQEEDAYVKNLMSTRLMTLLDLNRDGKVDQEDLKMLIKRIVSKFDLNKDGKVDDHNDLASGNRQDPQSSGCN